MMGSRPHRSRLLDPVALTGGKPEVDAVPLCCFRAQRGPHSEPQASTLLVA
jgi:hypothetical protein